MGRTTTKLFPLICFLVLFAGCISQGDLGSYGREDPGGEIDALDGSPRDPIASEGDPERRSHGIHQGTRVALTITNDLTGSQRQTNLTFGGTGPFLRSDGVAVETYEVWSDTPAFRAWGPPASGSSMLPFEYHRPRSLHLFESDRLGFVAIRPDGPREVVSMDQAVIRAYQYPFSYDAPAFLPPFDPVLFLPLVPLHLGFQDRSYEYRTGQVHQVVLPSEGGVIVLITVDDEFVQVAASLRYTGADWPSEGLVGLTDPWGNNVSWSFTTQSFIEGDGPSLVIGDAASDHAPYAGPRYPFGSMGIGAAGHKLLHPDPLAFASPDGTYMDVLGVLTRHPEFVSQAAAQDGLVLTYATWYRYFPTWNDLETSRIWMLQAGNHGRDEPTENVVASLPIWNVSGKEVISPHPFNIRSQGSVHSIYPGPAVLETGPLDEVVQRFLVGVGSGTRVDMVDFMILPGTGDRPAETFLSVGTGCNPDDPSPATVVVVDAATLEARYAFYDEEFSTNPCNVGLKPPMR